MDGSRSCRAGRGDSAGAGDGRQQRDRRPPAHPGVGRTHPRVRRTVPVRRRPGDREGPPSTSAPWAWTCSPSSAAEPAARARTPAGWPGRVPADSTEATPTGPSSGHSGVLRGAGEARSGPTLALAAGRWPGPPRRGCQVSSVNIKRGPNRVLPEVLNDRCGTREESHRARGCGRSRTP